MSKDKKKTLVTELWLHLLIHTAIIQYVKCNMMLSDETCSMKKQNKKKN